MNLKDSIYSIIDKAPAGHAFLQARWSARHPGVSNELELRVRNSTYEFDNRSMGCDKLCIVLAGYKEPLWDDVFARLAAYAPDDADVCIMTSGLYNAQLAEIARVHGWSYLSTSVNHLSHIQNIAIDLHPHAQWIYKIDEDIFLTNGFFETLYETWQHVELASPYTPAFVSPLLNVNCFGYLRLLAMLDLLDDFAATSTADLKYTDGLHSNTAVLEDPNIAKYLWGETQPVLRNIDALNDRLQKADKSYAICPIRFSIGAILFSRDNWKEFGGFPITFVGSDFGLGDDEEHIGHYAFQFGKAIVVSENSLVGHLGYGPQTAAMMDYYQRHKEQFALPSKQS